MTGTFVRAQGSFLQYIGFRCSDVTEMSYQALKAHALKGVHVKLELDTNEGHFTVGKNCFPSLSRISS